MASEDTDQKQQQQQQNLLHSHTTPPADGTPPPTAAASGIITADKDAKKPPGSWSPFETMQLIEAYKEKWYSLKRGQLRSRHWDEVALSLASRCKPYPDLSSPKSSVQCRHKLEKLRRRYRAERQICLRHGPGSSQWPFYDRMDAMEHGPKKKDRGDVFEQQQQHLHTRSESKRKDRHENFEELRSASKLKDRHDIFEEDIRSASKRKDRHESFEDEDPEDAYDSDQPPPKPSKRPNLHRPLNDIHEDPFYRKTYSDFRRNAEDHARFAPPPLNSYPGIGFGIPPAEDPASSSASFSELVAVMGSLGEAFLRMEQMKIQMQRETERFRADLELRRTEMVLDSQKQIADLFVKALLHSKRSKKPQSPQDDDD